MAYQLRSRGDPVTTESQEQTDISGEQLTEHQVTTPVVKSSLYRNS